MAIKKIHIRRTHGKYHAGCEYRVPDEIDEKLSRNLVRHQRARIVAEVLEQIPETPIDEDAEE